MRISRLALYLAPLSLAASAQAQDVLHYWDFSTTDDVIGGVTSNVVGTPDLSLHPTYGEAYPGAGASLNTLINGVNGGSGFLSATVFTGPTPGLQLGMDDYSVSAWFYDDFAGDADARGPRLFDCLSGTSIGLQQAGDAAGSFGFRSDDDLGGVNIVAPVGFPFQDRWVHVVVTVDRTANVISFYVDGAFLESQAFITASTGLALTGDIFPSQDLFIGAINDGINSGGAQTQGMDDLAFYRGLLQPGDIAALASGAVTPLDFQRVGTDLCSPATANSTGDPAALRGFGSGVASDNDLTLVVTDLPAQSTGYFITSQDTILVANPGNSVGDLCIASFSLGRYSATPQNTGAGSMVSMAIDLTSIPIQPAGPVAATAGSTWYWQYWYRDMDTMGAAVSNFSDAVCVVFE
ncbi:hypothetical protein Poly30_38790 [Planctomycetes bacterium Poly30]|uniref:LamG-like jellyroll fold domain-containing protein n=1 Tax=Saltatorellus ferox TaxID=2528018 RepID=A0A518EW87_9BACT|nr:hypothetical protein Poly30_38790 [Planctomycetes bacterium Poly30]